MIYNIRDTEHNKGAKAELGDQVYLGIHSCEVVACQETDALMLNIDADQLQPGDLKFIKSLGLTISNPDTDKPVAVDVDYKEDSFGERIKKYFESSDDDDDDSSFFSPSKSSSIGFSFGGAPSFGGFGGGSFGGGGASRSF